MSDSALASVTLPSLRAARSARERLAQAGFARNSIDIERRGDEFEVSISTKLENLDRAQDILLGNPVVQDIRDAGSRAIGAFHDNRPLALGLAAVAGFAIFHFSKRR
ncbi:hypothetical protein [Methylobacterium sp. 77]|uniref:hypothetical protein n=1 Tax=Methylobacterium sp. 77 TaxID=1101192 RepID=UPI00047B1CF0|nr:hypothetical protein [Methylobacterium sp. 77]